MQGPFFGKCMKSRARVDRFLFISFLLFLIWIPLPLGSNRPWAESILELWIFSIGIGWIYLYVQRRVELSRLFSKIKIVLWLLLLWLLWLLIQIAPMPAFLIDLIGGELQQGYTQLSEAGIYFCCYRVSVDPNAGIDHFLLSLALVLVFLATIQFSQDRNRILWIGYTLVISGVLQAFYASFMTLSGSNFGFFFEQYLNEGTATGTFINRNHLAGYLEMTLAVGIGLLIANLKGSVESASLKQRIRNFLQLLFSVKAVYRLSLVIMVIALILTRSRMGNSAFFFSIIIAGAVGLILSRYATKSTVIFLGSLLVIDILLIGSFFGVEEVAKRLEETSLRPDNRYDVNLYSLALIKDHLIVGTGLGSYYVSFMAYGREGLGELFFDHAHNDYFELVADTGLIGFMLLGLIVLYSLFYAIKAQKNRHDPLMRGISFAAIMGISALLIHSSVDFNLQIPSNAATFMVLLAYASISLHFKVEEKL